MLTLLQGKSSGDETWKVVEQIWRCDGSARAIASAGKQGDEIGVRQKYCSDAQTKRRNNKKT